MSALVLASGVVTARSLNGHRAPSTEAPGAVAPTTATTSAPIAAGPPPTLVITRYEDVIDRYVVATPVSAVSGLAGGTEPTSAAVPGDAPVSPGSDATASTSTTAPGGGPASTTPFGTGSVPTTGSTGTTGTTAGTPSSTTTTRPPTTTTTTRPPGVPADWPADEPIPPMPPGCREPKLEDDGEWNCQH